MKTIYQLAIPLLMVSTQASAAALYFYEVAGEDVGLANAGIAARAQDASVLNVNPAGLAHVEGKSFSGGAQLIYGDVDYTVESSGAVAEDTVGSFPTASGFYSQQIDDHWTAGIGMYGNFGSSLDFGDTFSPNKLGVGDSEATIANKVTLMALTVAPTVAYRVNDQWSVGVGVNMNYGIAAIERQGVNGKVKDDDQDIAFAGRIGVLYEYDDNTRIGLGYTSESDYKFHLDGLFGGTQGLSAKIKTPQQAMLSVFHQMNADWALMGNIGWQNWHRYDDTELMVPAFGYDSEGGSHLRDTYHLALGSQYQVTRDWRWNVGVAFDSSPFYDRSNGTLSIPGGNELRIGTGAAYNLDDSQTIGFSMEYLYSDDVGVQAPIIAGSYESRYYFFNVFYNWKSS